MVNGIIGKKVGMVQIFDEDGRAIGCTLVEVGPCTVIQKKEKSRVQLGFSPKKEKSCTKPLLGHFKKAGVSPFRVLKEFTANDPDSLQLGQEIAGRHTCAIGRLRQRPAGYVNVL